MEAPTFIRITTKTGSIVQISAQEIVNVLPHITDSDLKLVTKACCLQSKENRKSKIKKAMKSFKVGERVDFPDKCGCTVTGTIQKICRTRIRVTDCSDGKEWRVNPITLSHHTRVSCCHAQ